MCGLLEGRSVVIYFVTSDGVKSWVMCTSEKKAQEYVQNHPEIEDYAITYTAGVSELITSNMQIMQKQMEHVKDVLNYALERM